MRVTTLLLWTAPLAGLEVSVAAKSVHVSPDPSHTSIARLLRSNTQSDEEARLAINFSGANKLLAPVKWTGSKIKGAVKAETLRLQGKTADEAFALLKLDQAGDKLLDHKQFSKWVSFMKKSTKQYPQVEMVKTLTTKYSDDALVKMLEAGKQVKATNKISRELQFIQMTGWMQQGKSMGDVIKLLKLGGGMDKLLVNPNLPILETYIHVFNKFNAGRQTSVIKELMGFHTEKVVSTALQAAKKSPETNAIATKLQAAQFRYWFDNKVKPPKIFGMLDMKKST
ncbi:secreted RxLR effector peptide protein, putative [Phytophthora infestans T30-4]|uniref:Secreted RxLR effector peptide protein, putative n=2 Tax=Phytophthora infestans TaxID=4787 RepID=D0NL35_PHYIT|nr:secreted RxLR effector peptide protein, putative [Phytophthora infestans T30-4]EEY60353.1 secreted RxLR effector peptide protein, putative [Phytophthora infestans T30-4]KAF4141574.1 hypothetical protein GN958_ATG09232 [Phytophthora infestans]|eukprot:XP_002900149.1 secreted RxLR effector peptide protein, putative [Phytophthora infestans T30-4]